MSGQAGRSSSSSPLLMSTSMGLAERNVNPLRSGSVEISGAFLRGSPFSSISRHAVKSGISASPSFRPLFRSSAIRSMRFSTTPKSLSTFRLPPFENPHRCLPGRTRDPQNYAPHVKWHHRCESGSRTPLRILRRKRPASVREADTLFSHRQFFWVGTFPPENQCAHLKP